MTASMASADSDGERIAIVGTGIAAVAAVINKLADIAYNAKLNAPPVNLMVFDTGGPRPKGDTLYPFQDRRPRLLHPFYTEKPPSGFPTFGEYVDKLSSKTPRLKEALLRPTYDQINDYMKYMLELAVVTAGASVLMKFIKTAIVEIRETITGGPTVIVLADGSRMRVGKVVRARSPRYMAGSGLSDQAASAPQRKDTPAKPRMWLTLDLIRGAADIALGKTGLLHDMDKKSHFLVVPGYAAHRGDRARSPGARPRAARPASASGPRPGRCDRDVGCDAGERYRSGSIPARGQTGPVSQPAPIPLTDREAQRCRAGDRPVRGSVRRTGGGRRQPD